MFDFYSIVTESDIMPGYSENPYAGYVDAIPVQGWISIDFLNTEFKGCESLEELIEKAKDTPGETSHYIDWLINIGVLTDESKEG